MHRGPQYDGVPGGPRSTESSKILGAGRRERRFSRGRTRLFPGRAAALLWLFEVEVELDGGVVLDRLLVLDAPFELRDAEPPEVPHGLGGGGHSVFGGLSKSLRRLSHDLGYFLNHRLSPTSRSTFPGIDLLADERPDKTLLSPGSFVETINAYGLPISDGFGKPCALW